MMNTYENYAALKQNEKEDEDYTILHRELHSNIIIMAIHGGGIEPGTIDIADVLAGCEYSFYSFKGLKKSGNKTLHVNSNLFDEPIALKAAQHADIVVSIHGAKDNSERIHVGGTNQELMKVITDALTSAGFDAAINHIKGMRGIKPENICNRCRTGRGVQLELSRGLRETLFKHLGHRSLRKKTIRFYKFVDALKEALRSFSKTI